MSNKVKVIGTVDGKTVTRNIPVELTHNFKFMQKYGFHIVETPKMEPILQEAEINDLNLEVEPERNFHPEVSKDLEREQLFALLDEKGIEYKKTYGIQKLKQLLNE